MIHSALALVLSTLAVQQGPGLTYQVPSGWGQTANPTNGQVTLMPRGLPFLRMASVTVIPPELFAGTAEAFHQEVLRRGTSTGRVLDQPRSDVIGAFQVTRFRHQATTGVQLWMSVYTARWADRGQAIIFSANAANMEQRYLPAADSMVAHIAVPQMMAQGGAGGQPPAIQAPSSAQPYQPPAGSNPGSFQPPPSAQPSLSGGGPNSSIAAGSASFGDFIYVAPQGWTTTPSGAGLLVVSPPSETGERCSIGLWPMTAAGGDLFIDASQAWQRTFPEFTAKLYTTAQVSRGISADGWEYVFLKQEIVPRGQQEPEMLGMLMVAKLGNREATVSWLSKAPLYSVCIDVYTRLPETWPRFFGSLRFRNWAPPPGSGYAQKITGSWESFGTSTGGGAVLQYAFTPVGRYAYTGVGQRYMSLSAWTAAVWTSTTFGDGSYSLAGNELTLKADNDGKQDQYWVRVEQMSEDGGRTWTDKLYLMQPMARCGLSGCPVKDSEIGFSRRSP